MSTSVILFPVPRIVRAYLIEQGVGFAYNVATDWAIATSMEQKKPVSLITIYEEASTKLARSHTNGIYENPGVTIFARSAKPEPCQYRAKLIMNAMDSLSNWEWVGLSDEYGQTVVFQTAIRARGIFNLGKDENGKWNCNMEYQLVVKSIT